MSEKPIVPMKTEEERGTGWKISRRAILLGAGSALVSNKLAFGLGFETLELFYPNPARHDTVAIGYCAGQGMSWEQRWDLKQFGPDAAFEIIRNSNILFAPQNMAATFDVGDKWSPQAGWVASRWTLRVHEASFPGGKPHQLAFIFQRGPGTSKFPSGWRVWLETTGWPDASDKSRLFGLMQNQSSVPLPIEDFIAAGGQLQARLPRPLADATLSGLFGPRIQVRSDVTIGVDRDLTWWAATDSQGLVLMNRWASCSTLRIVRTYPKDEQQSLAGPASPPHELPRLLDDASPASENPGLYGEAVERIEFARSEPKQAPRLLFGKVGSGAGAVTAVLEPASGMLVRAAVRQWGDPAFAASALQIHPKGGNNAATAANLDLLWQGAPHRFRVATVDIERQAVSASRTDTRARFEPSSKEHRLETPFGPFEVLAPDPIPQRTEAAAQARSIRLSAMDGSAPDSRTLFEFDAVLALRSIGLRLPVHAQAVEPGEHVARLDFAAAECRFELPALGQSPGQAQSDGLIPLGPIASGRGETAFVDLGLAKLTVLRPVDLLSLGFRFSGLLLELRRRGAGQVARVLPSRGGPVCRASNMPAGAPGQSGIATLDTRPVLVVDFPPQHVAERAYYRRDPAIELPHLAADDVNTKAKLDRLRQDPKPPGADPMQADRADRIKCRQDLWEQGAAGYTPKVSADFATAFKKEAAKRKFPEEQRYYLSPEFLDPQSRRLAIELLSAQAGAPDLSKELDVELPQLLRQEVLAPFFGTDIAGFDPADDTQDKQKNAADAIERAKEGQSADYAEFRARYAAMFAGQVGDGSRNGIYRGWPWFAGVSSKLPKKLVDWVNAYPGKRAGERAGAINEARLSGPTRLAFRINCDDFQAERENGGFDFSLEALTDWGSMDLAVVRRAERLFEPNAGPARSRWARKAVQDDAAILRFQGITSGDWIAAAEDKNPLAGAAPAHPVSKRFPASRVKPRQRLAQIATAATPAPDLFQTAIELPFRLFLSPAQDASWLTPQDSVWRKAFPKAVRASDRYTELWSARLAGSKADAGVRAVWSPDFRPDALLAPDDPGMPPHGNWAPWSLPRSVGVRVPPDPDKMLPFRSSLDAYDRHELVALTSLHGLPVLGRRSSTGEIIGGSQFNPPPGFFLANIDKDRAPSSKSDSSPKPLLDYSAIYRPQPLDIAELSLTALGGNLDLETSFTPPASARSLNHNLFDAMSIERWRHRTVLGRDVLVEVVYKGFLFPIGHKATLVKITERRFEQVEGGAGPVAVLTQRKFLRLGDPVKNFPAFYQPNAGRRWPCTQVTITTKRTPDLIDPINLVNSKDSIKGTGQVFWPKTGSSQDSIVRFEMLINDESAPGPMPLLFMDNTAAHDETTVANTAAFYNQLDPNLRMMPRNGQSARMAPETRTGDTSCIVDHWIIEAEGRERTAPRPTMVSNGNAAPSPAWPSDYVEIDNSLHAIDPFMEGQDQPGFYPYVALSHCRLAQVERFTGAPNRFVDVTYDGYYTANGFQAEVHELFLRLDIAATKDALTMRMAGSDKSGGVAQPNLNVVGLSRSLGPIGMSDTKSPVPKLPGAKLLPSLSVFMSEPAPVSQPPPQQADALPVPQRPPQVVGMAKDIFPTDAKLLGLISLSDVLKIATKAAAPVLKEVLEYGAAGAATIRQTLSDDLLRPVDKLLAGLQQARSPTGQPIDLNQAIPDVGNALSALRGSIGDSLSPGLDDAAFLVSLAAVYEAGRAFVAAVERVLRDPLASLGEAQAKFIELFRNPVAEAQKLTSGLKSALEDFTNGLTALIRDANLQRVLVQVPMPDSVPAAVQLHVSAVLDGVVSKALADTLGDSGGPLNLQAFPAKLQAALIAAAQAEADTQVQAALNDIAGRVALEQDRVDAFLNPKLRQLLHQLDAAARDLGSTIGASADAALDGLARSLGPVITDTLELLDQADLALGDACQTAAGSVGEFLHDLLAALLPLDDVTTTASGCEQIADSLQSAANAAIPSVCPAVTLAQPGTSDPIALLESCAAARDVVQAFIAAECTIVGAGYDQIGLLTAARKRLARNGRDLALAMGRIARELQWLPDWTQGWTDCLNLPPRAVRSVTSLLQARDAALAAARQLTATLADAATALRDAAQWAAGHNLLTQALTAALRRAGEAVATAGLTAARLQRAATLLAAAAKPGEGGTGKVQDRAKALTGAAVALDQIAAALPAGSPARQAVADTATALKGASATLTTLESQSQSAAASLRNAMAATDLNVALGTLVPAVGLAKKLVTDVQAGLEKTVEQTAIALTDRLLLLGAKVLDHLVPALTPVTTAVATGYELLVKARNTLQTAIKPDPQASNELLNSVLGVLRQRFGDDLLLVDCAACSKPLSIGSDKLAVENQQARDANAAFNNNDAVAGAAKLGDLVKSWEENGSAVQIIVGRLRSVVASLLRTVLLSVIDLRAIQREIETQIRKLVPSRVRLEYDLRSELSRVPDDEQTAIFKPAPGTELVVRARTMVDLLSSGAPQASVRGEVGPFGIKLLGAFDVVTLNFLGLTFEAGTGASPNFKVRFSSVTMGEQAKFLQSLQDFLSPKGSGLYVHLSANGIEAGYGVNLGVIGIGTLSFSNVILSAGVVLPFDNTEAQFTVAIGRSDAPFLISSTIFGGGGFLSLTSNSRQIVRLEASFDYGGVAAFGFGPLTGMGRLTLGFYLRKDGGLTTMGGTFFAGGAAHIACFGISASLMVRMTYVDGAMSGEATFSFSFSFGLGDIEFHVTVHKDAGGQMGDKEDQSRQRHAAYLPPGNRILLADAGALLPGASFYRTTGEGGMLRVSGVVQERDWRAYRDYFDVGVRPARRRRL